MSQESNLNQHNGDGIVLPHVQRLLDQALVESKITGVPTPPEWESDDSLADYFGRVNSAFFGVGDPNQDGQKRNLAVAVFQRHTDEAIWMFVDATLARWSSARSGTAWYADWFELLARRDSAELAATLIGHDEVATRRRGALTCAGMLGADEVLRIKRKYR